METANADTSSQKSWLPYGASIIAGLLVAGGAILAWRVATRPEPPAPPRVSAGFSIIAGPDSFIFTNQRRVIGNLPQDKNAARVRALRQAGSEVSIAAYPATSTDSYSLFDTPAPRVLVIDLANDQGEVLGREGRLIGDISPDGRHVAWLEYAEDSLKIIVTDRRGGNERLLALDYDEYRQAGDLVFSPDGTRLAFAAAVGFPGREAGAVFVWQWVTKNQAKQIAASSQPDHYLRIKDWKNNKELGWKEVKR